MPGAYAHITLVNMAREKMETAGIPVGAIAAVGKYLKYCEMGAVGPDYPYLALGDAEQQRWADRMHYDRTGDLIHAGVRLLGGENALGRQKRLAWLLGFAAHVTMDVTVHPVVQLLVGAYKGHEKEHRVCEMHQDVHIYQRLNLGEVGEAEHVKTGIAACGSATDRTRMDPEIATLWGSMLREVHAAAAAGTPPDFDRWHRGFVRAVDRFAEEGGRIGPIARHVMAGMGLMYPAKGALDRQYLQDLKTPVGKTQSYDQVFDAAVVNVLQVWKDLASGVLEGTQAYMASIGNWDLDTGQGADGKHAFWRVA
jgi:hypothetical protein